MNPSIPRRCSKLLELGFGIFPVRARGKGPLTEHGFKDATHDAAQVAAWSRQWPGCNWGIALGAPSGYFVLDFDTQDGAANFEHDHGRLPATYTVQTARGFHFYFRLPNAGVRTQKFEGGELRSDGSYVVGEGSMHPTGAGYECVCDAPIAEFPPALLEQFRARHPAIEVHPEAPVSEGRRNVTLASLAGTMRRRGMTPEAIEVALLAENAARCEPTLPEAEVRRIAASVARYAPTKTKEPTTTGPTVNGNLVRGVVSPSLANEIRRIVLSKETALFDKRRQISTLVEAELRSKGEFFRTSDVRGFYFHNDERRLYDLEQDSFHRLLGEISGLSATENFFRFALDVLQTKALRSSSMVEVNTFSYFNPETHLLAVSDGGTGTWIRESRGGWREAKNGDSGLYFLTDSDATPWIPEFKNSESREWWLNLFLFSGEGLSVDDARVLIHLWAEQQFFPPLRRTRVIPCFLGGQGSGKTTAMRLIGRLLVGPNFDVTGVQRDREDALVAAVTNRIVLGLDNVDSKIPYLPDALALYATGQRYRFRKLYTTNEEVSYVPRAILLVSSRDPRFNRPDVTERLLPLYFSRPEAYLTEDQIFSSLEKRRGEIMGSFLTHVGEIADALSESAPKPLSFRMADFASFGDRVFSASGKSHEFLGLLVRLEKKQAEFASENDGLVFALQVLLERSEPLDGIPVAELCKKCNAVADEFGLLIPQTVQGFGQRLSTMRRVLELELGVIFTEIRGHERKRLVALARRTK